MKKALFLILLLILCSFAPENEEGLKITFPLIAAALLAIYEGLSRIIPTCKVWSVIGKILEFLTWLSNLLDRKKK